MTHTRFISMHSDFKQRNSTMQRKSPTLIYGKSKFRETLHHTVYTVCVNGGRLEFTSISLDCFFNHFQTIAVPLKTHTYVQSAPVCYWRSTGQYIY